MTQGLKTWPCPPPAIPGTHYPLLVNCKCTVCWIVVQGQNNRAVDPICHHTSDGWVWSPLLDSYRAQLGKGNSFRGNTTWCSQIASAVYLDRVQLRARHEPWAVTVWQFLIQPTDHIFIWCQLTILTELFIWWGQAGHKSSSPDHGLPPGLSLDSGAANSPTYHLLSMSGGTICWTSKVTESN